MSDTTEIKFELTRFVYLGQRDKNQLFSAIKEDGMLGPRLSYEIGARKVGISRVGSVVEGMYNEEMGRAKFPFKMSIDQAYNDAENIVPEMALKHKAELQRKRVKDELEELDKMGEVTLAKLKANFQTYSRSERGCKIAALLAYLNV